MFITFWAEVPTWGGVVLNLVLPAVHEHPEPWPAGSRAAKLNDGWRGS